MRSSYVLTVYPQGVYNVFMREEIKKKAMRRLRIVEGQVRGLQKMIEEEKYCVDVITQTSAVKEALSGVQDLILENHLHTHVVEQITGGEQNKAVKEILKVYKVRHKNI